MCHSFVSNARRGVAVAAAIAIAAGCGGRRSDPPLLVPWKRVGDIWLGESKARVIAEYGAQGAYGYRLHGGRVLVEFFAGGVTDIWFTTSYYRTKHGFGVGSGIPFGSCYRTATNRCEHRWHGFIWNAWSTFEPCNCWTKVGRGPRSLPATGTNFLKPWFIIYVKRGRVTQFHLSSRYID